MDEKFDADYWQSRWDENQTGWDVGHPSTPLKEYIDGLADKSMRILIPGCGNAYEGEYLFEQGFKNSYFIDIAPGAVDAMKRRTKVIPEAHIVLGDFFEHKGTYDLILEQTFFCALDPSLRRAYAEKMHELIKPGGMLAGVLFEGDLFKDHPPFGGDREEYRSYFEDLFEPETFERCRNSIGPREGRELFIRLRR